MLARIYEPFIQIRHDRSTGRRLKFHEGAIQLNAKIAIFLIFQPSGLSATTLLTCSHLAAKGYAPLVISNAPVSDDDLELLKKNSWKVITRPNYGYDFGGYRDGVLWILDQGFQIDRMIILNDSIWFPAWPDENLIDRMEDLPADLVGAVLHPEQKRRRGARMRPAFLESYFYIVNRGLLQNRVFLSFWRNFRVSSIKYNAVYRGERSFPNFLQRAGFKFDGVIDADRIFDAILKMDNLFLQKTLAYGAYVDSDFEAERDRLVASQGRDADWRAAALDHIRKVLRRRSSYASFPYASFHLMGIPFIKKSSIAFLGQSVGSVQKKMRSQLLLAVNAGDIPPPLPEVLREIQAVEPQSTELLNHRRQEPR